MRALFWLQEEPVWSHVKRLSERLNDPTRQPQSSRPWCELCSKEPSQVGLTNLKVCCKKPAIGCLTCQSPNLQSWPDAGVSVRRQESLNGMLKELQQWAAPPPSSSTTAVGGGAAAARRQQAHNCAIYLCPIHIISVVQVLHGMKIIGYIFFVQMSVFKFYLKFYFILYIFLDMYFRHFYIFFYQSNGN